MSGFVRAYCKGRLVEWRPDGDQWTAVDKASGATGSGETKDAAYLALRGIKEMPNISLITNVDAAKYSHALAVAALTVDNKRLKADLLNLKYKLDAIKEPTL